jgi:hypothetical protein
VLGETWSRSASWSTVVVSIGCLSMFKLEVGYPGARFGASPYKTYGSIYQSIYAVSDEVPIHLSFCDAGSGRRDLRHRQLAHLGRRLVLSRHVRSRDCGEREDFGQIWTDLKVSRGSRRAQGREQILRSGACQYRDLRQAPASATATAHLRGGANACREGRRVSRCSGPHRAYSSKRTCYDAG